MGSGVSDRPTGRVAHRVLPAAPDTTGTGTATLDPNTDSGLRVFSQESSAFTVQAKALVTEDGPWSTTVDLSDAVDGQSLTVEAVFGGVVASAPVLVGPMSARVRIDDQERSAGQRRVHLTSARLARGDFVVGRDEADGSIRGVSHSLEAGQAYSSVPIPQFPPITTCTGTPRPPSGTRLPTGSWSTTPTAIRCSPLDTSELRRASTPSKKRIRGNWLTGSGPSTSRSRSDSPSWT